MSDSTNKTVIESTDRSHITAVAFTSDGHIFGGNEGGEVYRWRIKDAQQVGPMMQASGFVESVAVSKDGKWLITGDDGLKGIVWNAETHDKVLEVNEHVHYVYAVDITSDSTRFATGSCDKTVRIFDITSGIRLIAPLRHDRGVVGLKFCPSGDRLATATHDVCVRIYNSCTGEKLLNIPIKVIHTPTTPLTWTPNGNDLFVVSPGKITRLNTSNSSFVEWPIHNNSTRASIETDGVFIACSAGSSLSLWDTNSHEQICRVEVEHDPPSILCVCLTRHGERLLAYGHGNKISVQKLMEFLPGIHLLPPAGPSYPGYHPLSSKEHAAKHKPNCHGEFGSSKSNNTIGHHSPAPDCPRNYTSYIDFFIERSRVRAASGLWVEALDDANEVIQMDATCHYAYECKYTALHCMGLYNEAIQAFDNMLSLIEQSKDPKIRQLRSQYVSSAQKQEATGNAIEKIFRHGPLVLIDVKTGRLYERHLLPDLFKADPAFKELVSSMTKKIDAGRIRKTVKEYFGYVMFSHVWGNGKEEQKANEPSFELVKRVASVHRLPNTPLNKKLRNFCAKVAELGYRWAWSDTCCIDKSDNAVLSRSLRSMYKWYESSDATLVFLADVSSDLGDLRHSLWMTRAWTLQEAFAPKRLLFYDRDWTLYRSVVVDNHKTPGIILEELANAAGISPETLEFFHPDSISVREKLRLASTRRATVEEDAAYSLIGIFQSDVTPHYGEGASALGHLLGGIVAHLGEVTVLAWTGSASSYHSCLPSSLAVYAKEPYTPPVLSARDMESRTTHLLTTLSKEKTMSFYNQIMHSPSARFAHRRLQLPCIVFHVRQINQTGRGNHGNRYCVDAPWLGTVEFTTADKLPLNPKKFVLVHPWIREIRSLYWGLGIGGLDSPDTEAGSEPESNESRTSPPSKDIHPLDEYTVALQTIARLEQPFNALLLMRQPGGEYRRVAAETEIIVQVSEKYIRSMDICIQVLDIL